jgi:hypothetical protein
LAASRHFAFLQDLFPVSHLAVFKSKAAALRCSALSIRFETFLRILIPPARSSLPHKLADS